MESKTLFLMLALAERLFYDHSILENLNVFNDEEYDNLKTVLQSSGEWKTEERPEQAVAILPHVFGKNRVVEWISDTTGTECEFIVNQIFQGSNGKFIHSAKKLGIFSKAR